QVAADTDPLILQRDVVGHDPDHLKKSRMVGIIVRLQTLVPPVHAQGKLGEIVGPYAHKVHFSCQLSADHHCSRGLDHHTHLNLLIIGDLLCLQFFTCSSKEQLCPLHFRHGGDHR